MSNWPIVAATRYETLGLGTGTGTVVTAGGSSNTKGSYATLGTAGFRYSGFMLCVRPTASGTTKSYRIDIAINTGGADTVLVEDFFFEHRSANVAQFSVFLPVRVPSGAAVKVRSQANAASETLTISLVGLMQDFPGIVGSARAISCTDFTNTFPTNSVTQNGTTYTAWTTIRASMPARVSRLILSPSTANDLSRTASDFLVDIGIGSAGNEVVLATLFGTQTGNTVYPLNFDELLCDIPAGVRLAFRTQCAAAAADSFSVAALGLAA